MEYQRCIKRSVLPTRSILAGGLDEHNHDLCPRRTGFRSNTLS